MTAADEFLAAYVECALWSSTDGEYDHLDANYGREDIDPEAIETMRSECAAFMEANAGDLDDIDPSQAGHDYWLTRNGHGTGYWDRGYGEVGDRLTDAATQSGESDLYAGDDGRVYGKYSREVVR